MLLRGMRYHPIDIENSTIRCHKKICEWCVVVVAVVAVVVVAVMAVAVVVVAVMLVAVVAVGCGVEVVRGGC